MSELVDIHNALDDPDDMPLCPLCDNPIELYEEVAIGQAYGVVALVHRCCAEEEL